MEIDHQNRIFSYFLATVFDYLFLENLIQFFSIQNNFVKTINPMTSVEQRVRLWRLFHTCTLKLLISQSIIQASFAITCSDFHLLIYSILAPECQIHVNYVCLMFDNCELVNTSINQNLQVLYLVYLAIHIYFVCIPASKLSVLCSFIYLQLSKQ